MKYLTMLLIGTVLSAVIYFSPIFLLFPSPVAAEYWIREMMIIKKFIAQTHKNKNKIIVLSGSSALFSIDTNMLSTVFNIPVINYGLMGGLPLETLFNEMINVVEEDDILILAFEPDAYCKEEIEGYREFEIRNAFAWNYPYWRSLSLLDKVLSLRFMSSKFPIEIVDARIAKKFSPISIEQRLAALDDDFILARFHDPKKNISDNLYSIYNVDALGNIKNTDHQLYTGTPRRADIDIKICTGSLKKIRDFKKIIEQKNAKIYFANTPFVKLEDLNYSNIEKVDIDFRQILSEIAPVLDARADLIFPVSSFLNTELHLNSIGRAARTKLLVESMKKNGIKSTIPGTK